MFLLPPLSPSSAPFAALCHADALDLAGCLAANDRATLHRRGIRLLQLAPGLVMWSVAAAYQRNGEAPRDLFALWHWMAPQMASLMSEPLSLPDGHWDRHRYQAAAAEAVRRASSITTAPHASSVDRHTEYLATLIISLLGARVSPSSPSPDLFPPWLSDRMRNTPHVDGGGRDTATSCDRNKTSDRLPDEIDRRWAASWPVKDRGLIDIISSLALSQPLRERFESAVTERNRQSIHQFAYGAGHELNNPLAIISARAQSLASQEAIAERRHLLNSIHLQSERAHAMIADMMLYASPPEIQRSCFTPADLIEPLLPRFRKQAAARDITVEYRAVTPVDGAPSVRPIATSSRSFFGNSFTMPRRPLRKGASSRSMSLQSLKARHAATLPTSASPSATRGNGSTIMWLNTFSTPFSRDERQVAASGLDSAKRGAS